MKDSQGGQHGLGEAFVRLRRAESAQLPSFAATLARARQRQRQTVARRGLWLYGTVSAAVAVVLTVITVRTWFVRAPAIAWSAPLGVELNRVTWNAPTDFLLDTPDAEALRGTPRLVRLRVLTPSRRPSANDTND